MVAPLALLVGLLSSCLLPIEKMCGSCPSGPTPGLLKLPWDAPSSTTGLTVGLIGPPPSGLPVGLNEGLPLGLSVLSGAAPKYPSTPWPEAISSKEVRGEGPFMDCWMVITRELGPLTAARICTTAAVAEYRKKQVQKQMILLKVQKQAKCLVLFVVPS